MSADGLVTTAGHTLTARLLGAAVSGEMPLGPTWFAFGAGNWADKKNPPAESVAATALASETARKRVSRVAYLTPNQSGTIVYNGQTYAETGTPTSLIAFFCSLTESELVGAEICEEALFGGTVVTLASPLATVAEVVTPGTMFWYRNRPQIIKGPRDTYDVVAIFEG